MAYSMPVAEVLGTVAGLASGELARPLGRAVADVFPVAGKAGRALNEALAAISAHYVGAATVKGLINAGLGDLFGLCMNTTVTSPASAGLHGVWVLMENLQEKEDQKASSD